MEENWRRKWEMSWIVCCSSLRGEKNMQSINYIFGGWSYSGFVNHVTLYHWIYTIKIMCFPRFSLFERSPRTTGNRNFEVSINCLQGWCWDPVWVSHRADMWYFSWLHAVYGWCFQFRGSLRSHSPVEVQYKQLFFCWWRTDNLPGPSANKKAGAWFRLNNTFRYLGTHRQYLFMIFLLFFKLFLVIARKQIM